MDHQNRRWRRSASRLCFCSQLFLSHVLREAACTIVYRFDLSLRALYFQCTGAPRVSFSPTDYSLRICEVEGNMVSSKLFVVVK